MSGPSPSRGVLAAAGWAAFAAALTPILLPASPLYRTVVAGAAVALFVAGLVAPRRSWPLALAVLAVSGVSALLFGEPEPAFAAPIPMAGFLAGSALRAIYDLGAPRTETTLLPLWRSAAGLAAVSASTAWVWARSWYLIWRDVPPPRTVNGLGADVQAVVAAAAALLAALLLASGVFAAAIRTGRDAAGRRTLDAALVVVALLSGGVALFQRLGLLPHLRAERWAEWNRAQSVFTDPSAAGIVAALLVAPLLARMGSGPLPLRLAAGGGVFGLLVLLADSGSRAGFLGALVSVVILVLWAATRLAVGERPRLSQRIALAAGIATAVTVAGLAAVVLLPGPGERPAVVHRFAALLEGGPGQDSGQERVVLYQAGGLLFQQHPISGAGLGTFRFRLGDIVMSQLGRPAPGADLPPSLYLGLLAEMGLAGGIVLAVFAAALLPALGRALGFQEKGAEEALRAAGAASGLIGLLVVFLFGSQLVYPEVAVVCALLTARLPERRDTRSARLVESVLPVALAAALTLSGAGLVARAVESSTPGTAFAHGTTAGVFDVEREPGGQRFRWTGSSAAFRVDAPPGRSLVVLPVKNARPAGDLLDLTVLWNDTPLMRVPLQAERWRELVVPVTGPGVLRLVPASTFRPLSTRDRRRLGLEVGEEIAVRTAAAR